MSEVSVVAVRRSGRGERGAVLRSGRSVDTERFPGGHAEFSSPGEEQPRAPGVLRPAGGQRSAGR